MEMQPRRSARLAAKMGNAAIFSSHPLIVIIHPEPTAQKTMAQQDADQPDFDQMAGGLVEVSAGLAHVSTNAQLVRNVSALNIATQLAEIKKEIRDLTGLNKRVDDLATQLTETKKEIQDSLANLDKRIDKVDKRIDKVEERVDNMHEDMKTRFDNLETSMVARYVSSLHFILSPLHPPLLETSDTDCRHKNAMAHSANGHALHGEELEPLVNVKTAEAIPHFPVNLHAIQNMTGKYPMTEARDPQDNNGV